MSNSPLISYTAISPNSSPRYKHITKITPHHMAGVLDVETCGRVFANPARQASSNYGIGNDGRIALYVPEDRRSWASSNPENDQQAVTIEVSNSSVGGDWPISDAAWSSLVALCVDICQRNGIKGLSWTGDASGSLTCHYMFAPTACPGPYLKSRMGKLASEVNARLTGKKEDDLKPVKNNGGDVICLWNKWDHYHHYVVESAEKQKLLKAGWEDHGRAFVAPAGGTVAIYRMYNTYTGRHLLTASYDEAKALQDMTPGNEGWVYEGVPFFGLESGVAYHRLYNKWEDDYIYVKAGSKELVENVAKGWHDDGECFRMAA